MTPYPILFVAALLGWGQTAADRPVQAATAQIRGRVTDRQSGEPVPRATIWVQKGDGQEVATRSDSDGVYAFTALPPGTYTLRASPQEFRATYVPYFYGEPDGAGQRPPLVLRAGDIRANVDIAMSRAFAISGRVTDDSGEPAANVAITARARESEQSFGWYTTDDRGQFRIFGIRSGRYIVCAQPPSGVTLHGRNASSDKPVKTCSPSSASESDAQVTIVKDADVEGIEIRLLRARTYTISGTILDASGAPADGARAGITTFTPSGASSIVTSLQPGGRFTVRNLSPGPYVIEAFIGGPDLPADRRDPERGYLPIVVDGGDVNDLTVAMVKTATVAGHVVFEDGQAPALRPGYPSLRITAGLVGDTPVGYGASVSATATGDLTFRLERLFGSRLLGVDYVPPPWSLKAIRYKGSDITEAPTEFKAGTDPGALEVILTTRGAVLTGTVSDDSGAPVRARIFMVPANRAQWAGVVRPIAATSSTRGTYALPPQRPGDYVIAAFAQSETIPQGRDVAFIERIVRAGQAVTLTENERRTVDLRVAASGDPR